MAVKEKPKVEKTERATKAEGAEKAPKSEQKPEKKTTKKAKPATVTAEQLETWKAELLETVKSEAEAQREELEQCIRSELADAVLTPLKRERRRRRWNNFFRDLLIVIWVAVAVYFGYCLYSIRYFSFQKSECERAGNCATESTDDAENEAVTSPSGPVKDDQWYYANYRSLFDDLQVGLNADEVEAYYLYSDDRKTTEIKPELLLGMAYNRVKTAEASDATEVVVTAEALGAAFTEMFGAEANFEKIDFKHGCLQFVYEKASDRFVAAKTSCDTQTSGTGTNGASTRKIVEEIERIYEEGEVIYVATTAALYDQKEQAFYRLDDWFRPAVKLVNESELALHRAQLNRYQYQFKRVDGRYVFSGITKLQ